MANSAVEVRVPSKIFLTFDGKSNDNFSIAGNMLGEAKLSKLTFCVLDVETTGLQPLFGDRICEIAVLKAQGERVVDIFHTLINPKRQISPGAYAVNRITAEMVKGAPEFKAIAPHVIEFLGDSVIVAHNAPFDLSFLGFELKEARLPLPSNPVIDTLALARNHFRFPSNSLGSIAAHYGIKFANHQHRALDDAQVTFEIFKRFLNVFRTRGVENLPDLLALQGGSIRFPDPFACGLALPTTLEEALKSGKRIKLRYLSSSLGETLRTVEPLGIVPLGDYLYLIAYCHLRQDRRTFRLDRILEIKTED